MVLLNFHFYDLRFVCFKFLLRFLCVVVTVIVATLSLNFIVQLACNNDVLLCLLQLICSSTLD